MSTNKNKDRFSEDDFYKPENAIQIIGTAIESNDINCILDAYKKLTNILTEHKVENGKYNRNPTIDELESKLALYFSKLEFSDIEYLYCLVEPYNKLYFFDALVKYNCYKKIKGDEFKSFLLKNNVLVEYVLRYKKLVDLFDKEITEYMCLRHISAEFLLDYHLADKNILGKYYLPKSLSSDLKMDIVEKYIESIDSNPVYYNLIIQSRRSKGFPLSDDIRLNAKKRRQDWYNENIDRLTSLSAHIEVEFKDINDEVNITKTGPISYKYTYSRNWIKNNLDYPTLLNNFIYLFEYTDLRSRSQFPSFEYEMGDLEKHIGIKNNRTYECGMLFDIKEYAFNLKLIAYCNELEGFNVHIEDVFKWFFEEYLFSEFKASEFKLLISADNTPYIEKIRNVFSELESVFKQFSSFVKYGVIDNELINISRDTIFIESIPSFINNKYGYITDKDLLKIAELLYSRQSSLAYIEGRNEYVNFKELIINEEISEDDLFDFQKKDVCWLIEHGIVNKGNEGCLFLSNKITKILEDFYYNEVICMSYYRNDEELMDLVKQNKIKCEGTLFSEPEKKYLNFFLNDRYYDNGYALRNKYMHGSNTQNDKDHKSDYFRTLKILSMTIIKINEEFCLREKISEEERSIAEKEAIKEFVENEKAFEEVDENLPF